MRTEKGYRECKYESAVENLENMIDECGYTQKNPEINRLSRQQLNKLSFMVNSCMNSGGSIYGTEFLKETTPPKLVLLLSNDLSLTEAPIAMGEFAKALSSLERQAVIVSPIDGPLKKSLISCGIPVIICPKEELVKIVQRYASLFEMIVVNTVGNAPVVSALNGLDTSVLWWIHEAEMAYTPVIFAQMPDELYYNVQVATVSPLAEAHLLKYRPQYKTQELLYGLYEKSQGNVHDSSLPSAAQGKTVFALVGTEEKRTGQDILLNAIIQLPESIASQCFFLFMCVGNPCSAIDAQIRAAVNQHPERIATLPLLNEIGPDFYRQIDCLICASRDDPMPVDVIGMLQHSGLVICSAHTGISSVLAQNNAGIIYGNDSASELAEKIIQVVQNCEDGFQSIRTQGRKVYKQLFSPAVFENKIKAYISDSTENQNQMTVCLQDQLLKNQHIIEEQKKTIDFMQCELDFLKDQLRNTQALNNYYVNTTCWKITKPVRILGDWTKKKKQHFLSLQTKQKRLESVKNLDEVPDEGCFFYQDCEDKWIFSSKQLEEQKNYCFSNPIKISVLVPLYNTPKEYLNQMIKSVREQTYSNWELCLADASDDKHDYVGRICRFYAAKDKRIQYKKLKDNYGISGNTNECLKMSTGDYLGLLDHDDVLHPAALHEIMHAICDSDADFIYTDETIFTKKPQDTYSPHFKPDYAPDNLLANNYICHFTVFSRAIADAAGTFRSEYDGSQDHDFILRAVQAATCVAHIPEVLYFWRACPGSVASDITVKEYAIKAGIKAVQDQIKRLDRNGVVASTYICPTIYHVRYQLKEKSKISIIIPNCDHVADLQKCLDSLFGKTTYDNFEVIIVENNSVSKETFDYYESIQQEHANLKVLYYTGGFNFSAICNYGADNCDGDVYVFLNNDTTIQTPGWLEEMLMYAQRKDVGVVGAKLYYPNGKIQHAGVLLGYGGVAGHYYLNADRSDPGYMGRLHYPQNQTAVTGACMMVRKSVFNEVEGFDPDFAVAFNDIDFCMKCRKKGYRNVWTPFAELTHYESKSRGYDLSKENHDRFEREVNLFRDRWQSELAQGDPYYNPNFDPGSRVFAYRRYSKHYPARITRKESGVF